MRQLGANLTNSHTLTLYNDEMKISCSWKARGGFVFLIFFIHRYAVVKVQF